MTKESGWSVLECPGCQATLKAPPGSESQRLQCPECGCLVHLDDATPASGSMAAAGATVTAKRGLTALPSVRRYDPDPGSVRGGGREEWEAVGAAPRDPHFTAPLHTTVDDDRRDDVEPGHRRERRVHEVPVWEQPAPVALETPRVRLGQHYRIVLGVLVMVTLGMMFAWGVRILVRGGGTLAAAIAAAERTLVAIREQEAGTEANPRIFTSISAAEHREAIALIKRFLAARTPEEMLPMIRDRERVEPMLRAYYQKHPLEPVAYHALPSRDEMQTFKNFIVGSVTQNDFLGRAVTIRRKPLPMLVDWETYVGYCEVPWAELGELRPTTPVLLRAQVSLDDYYNYAFSDPETWQCFHLFSFRGEHHIYAYARRGTVLRMELDRRARFNRVTYATVRVRFPPDAPSPNQVELTEFVADGWLLHNDTKPIAVSTLPVRGPASSGPKPPAER